MKHSKLNVLFAFVFLFFIKNSAMAVIFSATLTTSVVHRTCSSNAASITYNSVVSASSPYLCSTNYSVNLATTKFELFRNTTGTGTPLLTNIASSGTSSCAGYSVYLGGSFDVSAANFSVGIYTVKITLYINDISAGTTPLPSTTFSTFLLGYNTQWDSMSEMEVGSTLNSVKRTSIASGSTYSHIQSLNTLDSHYRLYDINGVNYVLTRQGGVIELSKKVASTNGDSRIYCVLSGAVNLNTFSPTDNISYLEFHSTATTNSIKLKYFNGTSWVTALLSSAPGDRIRITRSYHQMTGAPTVQISLNNSTSVFSQPLDIFPGQLKISIFGKQLNDEALNVVSTFPCAPVSASNVSYAELSSELKAGSTFAAGGVLKFNFTEENKIETGKFLPYKIYNDQQQLIASCSITGVVTGGAKRYAYNFDDNRYLLDIAGISGIILDRYYSIEVEASTGEKQYLRFFYKN